MGRSHLSASTALPAVVSVHAANSESQPRRLVHMGVVVGDAPATTIHWRRLSRSCFRAVRICCRVARFTSRNSASSGPTSRRALPWYLSMETSPFGEGCKPTESRANSTRKLQIRSPRLLPGASWFEGGGVRAGYSGALRRSCEKSVPTGSFEALGHSPLVRAGSQATSFVVGDGCAESSANMLSGMPNRPLTSRDWASNRTTHRQCYRLRILDDASVRCDV